MQNAEVIKCSQEYFKYFGSVPENQKKCNFFLYYSWMRLEGFSAETQNFGNCNFSGEVLIQGRADRV